MDVREATADERAAVLGVLDGAALATDAERVRAAIERGDVLVAAADGPILGALVLDGDEIEAVAVRRARRDQGIGRALVEAAAARRSRLLAEFDPRVRPFWASLDFSIEPSGEADRFRGVRE